MQVVELTPNGKSESEVMPALAERKFQLTVNGAELLLMTQLLMAVRGPDTSYACYTPDVKALLLKLGSCWAGRTMPVMIDAPKEGIRARGIP